MRKHLTLAALAVAPLALALSAPRAAMTFAPGEDAELTYTFETRMDLVLDDFSMMAMGQDMSAMMGDPEASAGMVISGEFTDTYGAVEAGRPTRITRSYGDGEIGMEGTAGAMGESESGSMELVSGLSGETVHFSWDEEEGDYARRFDDEERDTTTLQGAEARVDMAFMLPEGEVEVGDSWEVDAAELGKLLLPGGDLAWDTEDGDRQYDEGDVSMDDEEVLAILQELFAGEATATLAGFGEGDEAHLATIELAIEVGGEADFADMVAGLLEQAIDLEGAAIPTFDTLTFGLEFEGEGTLVWDTRAHHAHSLTASGDIEFIYTIEAVVEDPQQTVDVSAEVVLSGGTSIDIRVES